MLFDNLILIYLLKPLIVYSQAGKVLINVYIFLV